MESGSPVRESRKDGQNIYLTITSIYLLVMSGIAISISTFFYITPHPSSGAGDAGFILFFIATIFSIPLVGVSVWGGLSLIRYRKGIIRSLIALILWSILSYEAYGSFVPSLYRNINLNSNNIYEILLNVVILLLFISNLVMYPILILGWRKVQKSKSHPSQNNSLK